MPLSKFQFTTLTAHSLVFVGLVSAVIFSVAQLDVLDAQVVAALEFGLPAELVVGEARWATDLVGHVPAVAITVAAKVGRDAMAAGTLEGAVLKQQQPSPMPIGNRNIYFRGSFKFSIFTP